MHPHPSLSLKGEGKKLRIDCASRFCPLSDSLALWVLLVRALSLAQCAILIYESQADPKPDAETRSHMIPG